MARKESTWKSGEPVEPLTTAFLAGQITTLGVAIGFMLDVHPLRDQLVARIRQELEPLIAAAIASPLPDDMQDGIESAMDLWLPKLLC